jgi:hypothetical protein
MDWRLTSMPKAITIIVLVIVTTSIMVIATIGYFSHANNNSLHTQSNLQSYINPVYGMKILYPAQWQEFKMGKGDLIVGFISYPQDESGMLENVIVLRIDPSYYSLSLQNFAQKELFVYKSQLHNFHLNSMSSGITSLGSPFHRMEYSYVQDQLHIKTMEILIRNSNHIYKIVYDSDASEYPRSLTQVKKMIDTMVLEHQAANQIANYYRNLPFVTYSTE